jgi:hypothetical protein
MERKKIYKKKKLIEKKNKFFSNLDFWRLHLQNVNIYFRRKYKKSYYINSFSRQRVYYLPFVLILQKTSFNTFFFSKLLLYYKKKPKNKKNFKLFLKLNWVLNKKTKYIKKKTQLYNKLMYLKGFFFFKRNFLIHWYNHKYLLFYFYVVMKKYFFKQFWRMTGNLFYKKTKNNFFLTVTSTSYGVLYHSSVGRFLKGALNIKKRRKSNISLKTLILLFRKHLVKTLSILVFNKVFFYTQFRIILKYVKWIIYGLLYSGLYINEFVYLFKKAHNGTRKKKKRRL